MSYVNFSYRVFGNIMRSIKPVFLDVKEDLYHAGMNLTLEEYLSTAVLTVFLAFFAENVLLSFIFGILGFSLLAAVFLAFLLSSAISGVLLFLFYAYPTTMAKNRESKIKKVLPFAISYMSTIASSKLPPIVLFKTLARFREYGEVASESKNIVRDVEAFGMTFSAAIKKEAKRTPSREFRELLWGINSVLVSGGNMEFYLKQKGDELMSDYKRRITKYAQDISLFVEIYLTLIITGSIFFIVLSSVISSISGGLETILVQSFAIFVLMPMLSIGFILILKSISPLE